MTAAGVNPIPSVQRYAEIDLLRGFGVLGILAINIELFSMPFALSVNPMALGDRGRVDFAISVASHLFFDQKFMTIFSLLFGAGMLIMTSRAESRSGRSAALHYRRMAWLLVCGLVHAYLIRYGDILVLYAVCGFLVYPLRRREPLTLLLLGVLALSVGAALGIAAGLAVSAAPPEAQREIVGFWAPAPAIVQEEMRRLSGWMAGADADACRLLAGFPHVGLVDVGDLAGRRPHAHRHGLLQVACRDRRAPAPLVCRDGRWPRS